MPSLAEAFHDTDFSRCSTRIRCCLGRKELGQTWSRPHVGKLKINGADKLVFIFAGGYNGDDDGDDVGDLGKDAKNRATRAGVPPTPGVDEGNAVFIVDAPSGALLWKFSKGTSTGFDYFNNTYRHVDARDAIPSRVTAINTNGDGYIARLYFADTGGRYCQVK